MPSHLPSPFQNRRILLGVTGGIAAYKVAEVASTLGKTGADVRVVLTDSAQKFISPLTFSTLSRHAAYTDADFWQARQPRPLHIELAEWAEVIAIAPLSANTLAKLAQGLADNLLCNILLACRCPKLLAPAMNTDMWEQPSVQRNWQLLLTDPLYHSVGPVGGLLACDRQGNGRMAEPSALLTALESILHTQGQRDWQDHRVLISTGSTREPLDPVRFIGNPASGRMGIALALAAQSRGAQVTLVHGPADPRDLSDLNGIPCIPITTAREMETVLLQQLPTHPWIFMAAAIADVRPAQFCSYKLPKSELPLSLPLEQVNDIAATLAQHKRPNQRLIGFAAQTGDILTPALAKLQRKGLDAIAANPIDQPDSGFASPYNQGIFLDRQGRQVKVPPCTKLEMAHRLLDFVIDLA